MTEGAGAVRNILLTVQFDGTDFVGWQMQPGQRSVQGVLAQAVEGMVQHPVTLYGSSRTDSGVHARALPVNFETPRTIPLHGFLRGLNAVLPSDLGVLSVEERPVGWRTRFESVAKTYVYRYQLGDARWPLYSRTAWHCRWPALDLDAMNDAAEAMLGEHDFNAFRSSRCVSKSSLRHMHAIRVAELSETRGKAPVVELEVTGNAFLHNMVRIIAGTMAEVGRGKLRRANVERALESGERSHAGPTAPPCGLTLWKVYFEGYPRLGKPRVSTQAPKAVDGPSDAG